MSELDVEKDHRTDVGRRGSSRRTLLRGAALLGVAAPVLAACGSDDKSSGSTPPASSADTSSKEPKASGGGDPVTTTADVPKGGGVILEDAGLVVTQPKAGDFKGFTNICTHMQCPLANVEDGTINCMCHGSMFSIENGSVQGGPATKPLPTKAIKVEGSDIFLA